MNKSGGRGNMSWCLAEFESLGDVTQFHNGVAAVVFSFVAVFVVLTNCFVLWGVCSMRLWRLKSMRLFMLLVLSDITIGIVTLPMHVILFVYESFSKGPSCMFFYALKFFVIFPVVLSEMGVLLIAVDRYFAILKRHVHTHYATNRGVTLVMLLAMLVAFSWGIVNSESLKIRYEESAHTVLLLVLGVFKLLIFISVGVIYYVVLKSVQKTAKTTRRSFINGISTKPSYDKALYRISMLITVSFILCHLPSTFANFFKAMVILLRLRVNDVTLMYVEMWTSLPMYIANGINGVLLIYGNRKLRRWFKKMFERVPKVSPESPTLRVRRHAIIVGPVESRNIQKVVIAFNAT